MSVPNYRWRPIGVIGLGLLIGSADQVRAGLFKVPEPELIYSGAAPGQTQGVTVLRDPATFSQDVSPLDPDFGGELPALDKRSVLMIVSRPLENSCRDAELESVSTRGSKAKVVLVERVPARECRCSGPPRPAKAWLVTVGRLVRRAELSITDVVVPCTEATKTEIAAAGVPVQLFEGSWDHSPGGEVITDFARWSTLAAKLNLGARAPSVDFNQNRVAVITGRPRENSCRQTKIVAASVPTPEEAVFEVDEVYSGPGQMCAQVIGLPRVFLYLIPSSVQRVRTTTREVR
jgi:hypothetical protein